MFYFNFLKYYAGFSQLTISLIFLVLKGDSNNYFGDFRSDLVTFGYGGVYFWLFHTLQNEKAYECL